MELHHPAKTASRSYLIRDPKNSEATVFKQMTTNNIEFVMQMAAFFRARSKLAGYGWKTNIEFEVSNNAGDIEASVSFSFTVPSPIAAQGQREL